MFCASGGRRKVIVGILLEFAKTAVRFGRCPKARRVVNESISLLSSLRVTRLEKPRTKNESGVESVVISDGIKELNSTSFFCLPLLQQVTIPDTVTRIGYKAFWGCESLTTIDIPSSVREIDSSAFGACYSLTEVNVHNAKGVIKTQSGEPFASEDDSKINWLG